MRNRLKTIEVKLRLRGLLAPEEAGVTDDVSPEATARLSGLHTARAISPRSELGLTAKPGGNAEAGANTAVGKAEGGVTVVGAKTAVEPAKRIRGRKKARPTPLYATPLYPTPLHAAIPPAQGTLPTQPYQPPTPSNDLRPYHTRPLYTIAGAGGAHHTCSTSRQGSAY